MAPCVPRFGSWVFMVVMLLWRMFVQAACETEAPASVVAGFAASMSLSAFAEVERLEASMLTAERSAASAAGSALDAQRELHSVLSVLLDTSLAALRFAAAADAAANSESPLLDVTNASFLEQQILALGLANPSQSPLYFWHGPRRMILSRLRLIFHGDKLRHSLKEMALRVQHAFDTQELIQGGLATKCERLQSRSADDSKAQLGIPDHGIVIDTASCSNLADCDGLWPALLAATAATAAGGGGRSAHLLLQMPDKPTLESIGKALQRGPQEGSRPALHLSVVAAPEWMSRGTNMTVVVKQVLDILGQDKLDMLWIPYKLFLRQRWAETKSNLVQLLNASKIEAYGLFAEVTSKTLLSSLLNRDPAPKAWLAPHDLMRPVSGEARTVADEAGVPIVALPQTPLPTIATEFLKTVTGPAAEAQESAQLLSATSSGMKAVAHLRTSGRSVSGVLEHLQQLKLDTCSLSFCRALAVYTSQWTPSSEDAAGKLDLVHLLEKSRLRQESQSASAQLLTSGAPARGEESSFQPGIRAHWLEDVPGQSHEFEKNNYILYREDFFDAPTFKAISREAARLWRSSDLEANCNLDGRNRAGGYVLDNSNVSTSLYHLVYGNEAFREWLSAVNGEGEMWPSDFPIELREYGEDSTGMPCHSDLQMYAVAKRDMEFVVTIRNPSACNVSFIDRAGDERIIHTKANSVMIVRPNAAVHCVSGTSGGSRTILKGIYVGDYRKSRDFDMYTVNSCDEANPNRQLLRKRRNGESLPHETLEL